MLLATSSLVIGVSRGLGLLMNVLALIQLGR